ncbi:MAG: hypothetical protein PHQ66_00595 [Candidatus Nanoarchaeia archaeon]|nr:hypothetical protein [Candidatus Nanoarchaeia archaeon]MDD5358055.1 hypothetical protein [Candidatus Nanoarchaeia archaeon]
MGNLEYQLRELCEYLVRETPTHKKNILISAKMMETVYQLMKDDSKKEENSEYITKKIDYLRRHATCVSD